MRTTFRINSCYLSNKRGNCGFSISIMQMINCTNSFYRFVNWFLHLSVFIGCICLISNKPIYIAKTMYKIRSTKICTKTFISSPAKWDHNLDALRWSRVKEFCTSSVMYCFLVMTVKNGSKLIFTGKPACWQTWFDHKQKHFLCIAPVSLNCVCPVGKE